MTEHDDLVARATEAVRSALKATEAPWEEQAPHRFSVELPGERKLRTPCSLAIGDHSLTFSAFVSRQPDENHAQVHRWLLERNTRHPGVAYALDRNGDIYLVGKIPLGGVTPDEVDRLLGVVLAEADGSFNTILEMGFADSIRREWSWRLARGESTANLAPFEHLRPR